MAGTQHWTHQGCQAQEPEEGTVVEVDEAGKDLARRGHVQPDLPLLVAERLEVQSGILMRSGTGSALRRGKLIREVAEPERQAPAHRVARELPDPG